MMKEANNNDMSNVSEMEKSGVINQDCLHKLLARSDGNNEILANSDRHSGRHSIEALYKNRLARYGGRNDNSDDGMENEDIWGESDTLFQIVNNQSNEDDEANHEAQMHKTTRTSPRKTNAGNNIIAIYKVIYNPKVVLRNQPNLHGQVVGIRNYNDYVEVCAQSGDWLRLRNSTDVCVNSRIPPIVTHDLSSETEWVLKMHPDLGRKRKIRYFFDTCKLTRCSYARIHFNNDIIV